MNTPKTVDQLITEYATTLLEARRTEDYALEASNRTLFKQELDRHYYQKVLKVIGEDITQDSMDKYEDDEVGIFANKLLKEQHQRAKQLFNQEISDEQ